MIAPLNTRRTCLHSPNRLDLSGVARRPHVPRSRAAVPQHRARAKHNADETDEKSSEPNQPFDKSKLMSQIKSFGVAGTASYVVTEIVFWAIALPGAWIGYHQTTGQWLSLDTDRAQLVGIAAAFVTGVRFMVPLRMGAALALVPTMRRLLDRGQDSADTS